MAAASRQSEPLGLLGHKHVRTTMVYTHVLNRAARGAGSLADPLGRLPGGSG